MEWTGQITFYFYPQANSGTVPQIKPRPIAIRALSNYRVCPNIRRFFLTAAGKIVGQREVLILNKDIRCKAKCQCYKYKALSYVHTLTKVSYKHYN